MQPNLSPNYFNNDLIVLKNIKCQKDKKLLKDDKMNLKIEVKNFKNDFQKKNI